MASFLKHLLNDLNCPRVMERVSLFSILFHNHCGDFNTLGPGSGTSKRCGQFGVGVACWRKYVAVGLGFGLFLLAAHETVFYCLPLEQDIELSDPFPAPSLPGH